MSGYFLPLRVREDSSLFARPQEVTNQEKTAQVIHFSKQMFSFRGKPCFLIVHLVKKKKKKVLT